MREDRSGRTTATRASIQPVSRVPSGHRVLVGGRVRHRRGSQHVGDVRLELVDALGSAPSDLPPEAANEGDLLVVEATLLDGVLQGCVVVDRIEPRRGGSAPTGERARFLETEVGHNLRRRDRIVQSIRRVMQSMDFLEVETPTIVPCPGMDSHLAGFQLEGESPPRFLATSPEYQMKRLLVGGIPRCFQIGRSYRRDESGRLHHPEFTMLEWYRAFASVDEVMHDTESIVLAAFDAGRAEGATSSAEVLARPFLRLSVRDAFARYADIDEPELLRIAATDETRFFLALIERVEPALSALGRPVFLDRWPAPMASLARLCPDDRRYAERFELYFRGVELCNGFGELTCPDEQRSRFEHDQVERARLGLPVYPLDEAFLSALEEGMPPSAGNALGLDRLVMLALECESLDDVIAFRE